MELKPSLTQGHLALAKARERQGDLQATLAAYRGFVANAHPEDERLREVRARIDQIESQ